MYAVCRFVISLKYPYASGRSAPPAIPIINNADPVFVNFPKPSKDSGQMHGHIRVFAKLNNTTKAIDTPPLVSSAQKVNTIPRTVLTMSAFF